MARYIIIFSKNIKIEYEYKYNNNIQNKITSHYNMYRYFSTYVIHLTFQVVLIESQSWVTIHVRFIQYIIMVNGGEGLNTCIIIWCRMMQILMEVKYVHGTTYKFNVYGPRIENKSTYIELLFHCLYIEIVCTIFIFYIHAFPSEICVTTCTMYIMVICAFRKNNYKVGK